MASHFTRIKKSDRYKYVTLYLTSKGEERWAAKIYGNGKYFDTEKEAAICIDKKLLEKGKDAVNILVKLNK